MKFTKVSENLKKQEKLATMQIFIAVCGLPSFSLRKRGNKATAASSKRIICRP